MKDLIKISIIIVSWRVPMALERCILSIKKYLSSSPHEIIVIDNNSNDQTVEILQKKYPDVRLIINQTNLGFALANNIAASQANGEYLLILNPDTEFIDNSIEQAIDYCDSHQEVGICGINIINRDLSNQLSVRPLPNLYSQIITLLKLNNIFPFINKKYLSRNFNYNLNQVVDSISGACFLIKKDLWLKLKGFDENYFIWFEEVDLCYRCKMLGYLVYYYASARVIHDGAQSFTQIMPKEKQKVFNHSLLYYFAKNKPCWQKYILQLVLPLNWLLTLIQSLFPTNKNVYNSIRSKN